MSRETLDPDTTDHQGFTPEQAEEAAKLLRYERNSAEGAQYDEDKYKADNKAIRHSFSAVILPFDAPRVALQLTGNALDYHTIVRPGNQKSIHNTRADSDEHYEKNKAAYQEEAAKMDAERNATKE